jgi:hypothetical protein
MRDLSPFRGVTTPNDLDVIETRILACGGEVARPGKGISFMPLTHRFTPGLYIREIFMPAGAIVVSRIHRFEHPYVMSMGRCAVYIDGDGWRELRAPHTGITLPGTRRLLAIFEDTIWTTFHLNPTEERDIATLEDMVCEDYQNPLLPKYKELAA